MYGPASLASLTAAAAINFNTGVPPVTYAGSAPTLACGVAQINLPIPADVTPRPWKFRLLATQGNVVIPGEPHSTVYVK